MTIDREDYGQVMLYYFPYCSGIMTLIRKVVRPGDVCIDLGVNAGLITAALVEQVGPRGLVIAVEPNSRLVEQITRTASALDWKNLHCLCAGIAGVRGSGLLSRPDGAFSESTEAVNSLSVREAERDSVPLMTEDDVIRTTDRGREVRFLKVDIEGSEAEFVRSAQMCLSGEVLPVILIEYHREKMEQRGGSPEEVRGALKSAGYLERQLDEFDAELRLDEPSGDLGEHRNMLYVHRLTPGVHRLLEASAASGGAVKR